MLKTIGAETLDQLIFETIPDDIIMKKDLDLDVAMTEQEYLEHITEMAEKNRVFKTYIGLGPMSEYRLLIERQAIQLASLYD